MPKYEHLTLKRLEGEFARRKRPGFPGGPARNPTEHGPRLSQEVEAVLDAFQSTSKVADIDPSLILRLTLAAPVNEAEWTRMGLTVLSEDANKTLILFADDKELTSFREKIARYQGELPLGQKSPPFAALINAIESVGTAAAEDRIGGSLRLLGFTQSADFDESASYILDVELYRPVDDLLAQVFVYRLEKELELHGGAIINTYIGDSLLLVRIEASGAGVAATLALPEVANAEAPARPDLQVDDLGIVEVGNVAVGLAPGEDAIAIGVIDSGVNSGHPLLAYAMRGSYVAQAGWADADEEGHGTSVASVAAYGDISSRVDAEDFSPPFLIASSRVLESDGKFPKAVTVPELMDTSIRRLHADYGCRIFNISLGDPNLVFDGGKAGPWASTLDELARELDVVIVVSTGNRSDLMKCYGEEILKQYPAYLLDPASRILDPATGANVITVGAIAHANGLEIKDEELVGVRPICSLDQPSPFTRTGPGVRGMIKPDFVDYGGNTVWDGPTKALVSGGGKASAGVWTFHYEPVDRLFRARSGTSFAAPVVAHKAAYILSEFPDASANFVRAVLGLSAEIPHTAAALLSSLGKEAPLMTCGNGLIDVEHATGSDDSRVVFFAEEEIGLDRFAVFEVPIPELFQTTKGTREIKVSMAFDPPVRRTRADYIGSVMGWRLIRGASEQAVFDHFRAWERAEGDPPEFPARYVCSSFPGPTLREKGTLQCASFSAKRSLVGYGNRYFVAVWCRRRWAPEDIQRQRYAIAVQLRHSAEINLYQQLTVPAKVKV